MTGSLATAGAHPWLLVAVGCVGCVGGIGGESTPMDPVSSSGPVAARPGSGPGAADPATASTASGAPPVASSAATADPAGCGSGVLTLGPTPLRRLTREEYRNSVADLFAVAPPAAGELPEDARFGGFTTTSGQPIAPAAALKYLDAAATIGVALMRVIPTLVSCVAGADQNGCVQRFLETTGMRTFRRPLAPDELAHYRGVYAAARTAGASFEEGMSALVQALLVAPQFLFVLEPSGAPATAQALDSWQVATRLSLMLWRSAPDPALLQAAARDELRARPAVAAHVQRMLADRRARPTVAAFFEDWLDLEDIEKVQKDRAKYPDVSSSTIRALATETRLFLDDVFWNQGATFDRVLVSPARVRSAALSRFYRDTLSAETKEAPVMAPVSAKSFGLLSQAGFLMAISRDDEDAIIYRGKFIRTRLLCGQIAPPPPGVASMVPVFKPGLTSRQRIETHTSGAACVACHSLMNPLGFALEHFGGDGRWRDAEGMLPIDDSTEVSGSDIRGQVTGALDLSQKLVASATVQRCVVSQLYEFALRREPSEADRCTIDELQRRFAAGKLDLEQLTADIAQSSAFFSRAVPKE